MIYKKVSNYENLSTIESVLSDLCNPDLNFSPEYIIDRIIDNFNKSFDEAKRHYEDYETLNLKKQQEGKRKYIKNIAEPGINISINNVRGNSIIFSIKKYSKYS